MPFYLDKPLKALQSVVLVKPTTFLIAVRPYGHSNTVFGNVTPRPY